MHLTAHDPRKQVLLLCGPWWQLFRSLDRSDRKTDTSQSVVLCCIGPITIKSHTETLHSKQTTKFIFGT